MARYVDIPLQHIHENMLERMRRETSRQYIVDLLRRIRAGIPGIALRTTFIVGFPGETEAYFEDLLEFIRETRFERLGVFTYSQEEGTRAGKMAGQIPDKIKQQAPRPGHGGAARGRGAGRRIIRRPHHQGAGRAGSQPSGTQARPRQLVGTRPDSRPRPARYRGSRAASWSPAARPTRRTLTAGSMCAAGCRSGEFAQVKIIGHTDYDLIAEPA